MKTRWLSIPLLFSGLLVTGGCQQETEKPATTQAPEATNMAAKEYPITGRVVSIAPDKSKITLDHDDIPGLMRAMEMAFTVDDPKILEGVEPGDEVDGRLQTDGSKYTITQLNTR
jgi:protein SCO1